MSEHSEALIYSLHPTVGLVAVGALGCNRLFFLPVSIICS